jgi:hypothetical protein
MADISDAQAFFCIDFAENASNVARSVVALVSSNFERRANCIEAHDVSRLK